MKVEARWNLGVGLVVGTVGHLLLLTWPAAAAVTQPDSEGTPVPQPTPEREIAIVTASGFPGDAITLGGLFRNFGDAQIDPVRDAETTPGTFSAQCGLRAALVLHGGLCRPTLGWYNATEPATLPTDIYPFVSGDVGAPPPLGVGCSASDFCPLAARTIDAAGLEAYTWADPLPVFDPEIPSDPNWTGGPVGLAFIGEPGSLCPQTKYSQGELNDRSPSGAPWVSAIAYRSIADPTAYYLAFEDQPTCPESWRGCANGGSSDGDFNDAVYLVSTLTCPPEGRHIHTQSDQDASVADAASVDAAVGDDGESPVGGGGTGGAGGTGLGEAGGAGGLETGVGGGSPDDLGGAGGSVGGAGGAAPPTWMSGGGCGCGVATGPGSWLWLLSLVPLTRARRTRR